MDNIAQVNNFIKRSLSVDDFLFTEHTDLKNPRIINFSFSLGGNKQPEDDFLFVISYDEKTNSILILTRYNRDISEIPEYDILQWINAKNAETPCGCFVYDKEPKMLYFHTRIDLSLMKETREWDADTPLTDGSILLSTAYSMFCVMQEIDVDSI